MAGDVQLRVGGTTDVGRLRDHNEDSLLTDARMYVVADGMGGHQGGEVASAIAVKSVQRYLDGHDDLTVDDLIGAVQDANRAIFRESLQNQALAGMGTTLVGLAVITDGETERIAIVNVGDSRAYRFRDGSFEQITDDHSLVGQLLRDGALTPEEAEHHPRKNIVTRALGLDDEIPVDDFVIEPQAGDRYLLCSDGLTDEVSNADIAAVLADIDSPDDVVEDLVRRANENGGRDNITVVVADVVAAPAPTPGARTDDADDAAANPVGGVPPARRRRRRGAQGQERRRGPRRLTVRSILFVILVAAIVGGGFTLVNAYATGSYHVTIVDDEVTIMKGRPGGFLWWDAKVVEGTGIDVDDVPAARLDRLHDGVTQSSLSGAERYVETLAEQIESIKPPVTTTTTTRPVTTTTETDDSPAPN